MNGSDILIVIGNDVVGSQRDVTLKETTKEIDVSSKTSRATRVIAGRYGATIDLEAVYVPSDTAYLALVAANRAGSLVTVVKQREGVDDEEAQALVTSISEKHPDQKESTVSISLTLDGEWAAST